MNMPLLRWAGERTGEARYADAADRHVAQLRQHIVRADDTTFHTFHWDPVTGEPLRGTTQQGYADDSCWARGQAWGVYGFAIDARETGNADSLATAVRVAEYFLDHLPADGVAYWDLVFTDGSDQPRDSSAAAIAASGLLELAPLVAGTDPEAAERYSRQAHAMLASLAADYTGADVPGSNALILHGVYDWPKSIGVDEGTLWGDYFYLEALVRVLRPRWQPYW
ncbi:glycoside hydrolase family 88 protein [Miniimonas sp. S16]|uniref:glycoside hydrolase family 88 protein n=1 Tax=Miniimonas sp. S16 TaxID=2171623 RepID=UPI001F1939FD|nr:glycoside hydrolase family 88 protein [Miniimonas sp. S16]